MVADLAYVFHWPPAVLWDMDTDELMLWHTQAQRIQREIQQKQT